MQEQLIERDEWSYSLPKIPKASKIALPPIHGVLPFDGGRNSSSRSYVAQKVFVLYRTQADNWIPRVGICESAAKAAVALELLLSPNAYNPKFLPVCARYFDEEFGKHRHYTHDLFVDLNTKERRLVFVRNEEGLTKPQPSRQISAIARSSRGKRLANDVVVANADDFTRQRRDNLFRIYLCALEPDPEADEIVLEVASRLKTLWHTRGHQLSHTSIIQALTSGNENYGLKQ